MIYSDETQKILREKNFITSAEIAMQSGDIILAENVLSKERRILDTNMVKQYVNVANITETKSNSKLLKG